MAESAIEVTGLSKKYGSFEALSNVSFNIEQGSTVGIIGRNGAGKTTLLNILSGIVKPSAGKVVLDGHVASILEVGTGFHPDLSGRDNVYLNGQLLGMSRSDVKTRFDEIVAFSEIEDFIDVPVKNYSSGMYLRLAFSVFAHFESDIILLDEVMSVGDAGFRRKCEKKIHELSRSGATILMVNHDVSSIQKVCSRCIYLENGAIVSDGLTEDVVNAYYEGAGVVGGTSEIDQLNFKPLMTSNGDFKISEISVFPINEVKSDDAFYMTSDIVVKMKVEKFDDSYRSNIILRLDNSLGVAVLQDSPTFRPKVLVEMNEAKGYEIETVIPKNLLNHGVFYLSVFVIRDVDSYELFEHLVRIQIERPEHEAFSNWSMNNVTVRPRLEWTINVL